MTALPVVALAVVCAVIGWFAKSYQVERREFAAEDAAANERDRRRRADATPHAAGGDVTGPTTEETL